LKHQHILVIRFSALGDVAMTVPVVYSLARQYPDVRITVLSRPFARQLFEDLAPNINFMEADLQVEYHGIKGLNALYRRLVAKQFTHIADLHSVLRSEYLRMRFNLGHYRVEHINKNRKGKRRLVAQSSKQLVQQPTSIQNYQDVFERLGFPVKLQFHSIFGEGKGSLMQLPPIFETKDPDEKWIGIAPFAAHEGKTYPAGQMLEVIRLLAARYPKARLLLFGRGGREEQYFPHWCHDVPQCINVSFYTETIREELILMSHLDVMLSMDSANMHLASLTATPVVSVWGATHPYAGFMGYGQSEINAVQLDMACRPCSVFGQKPCFRGDYACMTGIKPEEIVEKVNQVLQTKKQE
jgi:ADP-heptose:LPS heptosyltransferase